ncbi:SCP2 sterol-binding domain-containing protein [Bacillus marasmi]|uniref:SCP2 sterol-binding domain-containing protein n=1 Tax=Bacillus marasmi TaxID=1926279 RepID=UPI0011CB463A|nr:SCP2 sterol-binding domain-containing protein [Bacillus marasmi]
MSIFEPFIVSFNQKSHLHSLVRHAPLQVCIDTEKGVYFLSIENEVAHAPQQLNSINEGSDTVTISTSYNSALELLYGKIKLREAQTQQLLTISGSLRATLLLEAILFLAKPDEQCA